MATQTLADTKLDVEEKEGVGAELEVNVSEEVATPEEEEEEDDESSEEKGEDGDGSSVKRGKRKKASSAEPVTPIQRPSRERKSVQRYSAPSSDKSSSGKGLTIQKGNGTLLKDIPNVAFKLSKRKADENLQSLHSLLFGKRGKTHFLKRNLLQFSGFVWVENEEKQKAKVRERLDKFVKEKLVDFCEVLDIPISKTATKKDDIVAKLLEFLESPHATTEVSLAEKEQARKGKKRRKKTAGSAGVASRDASSKKQRRTSETKKRKANSPATDEAEDDEFQSADTKLHSDEDEGAVMMQKKDSDKEDGGSSEEDKARGMKKNKKSSGKKRKHESEDKTIPEKGSPKRLDKGFESERSPTKSVKSPGKSLKSPVKSPKSPSDIVSKKGAATERKVSASNSKSKELVDKSQKKEKKSKPSQTQNASSGKEKTSKKQSQKGQKSSGKGEGSAKSAVTEPSRDEMHAAVSSILKEVDFNTATLSDILRKLESNFKMSLGHRKSEVKSIIEEVINSMSDEEDQDEGEGDAGDGSEGGDEDEDDDH